MPRLLVLSAVLVWALAPLSGRAQLADSTVVPADAVTTMHPSPHATLAGWAARHRRALLDKHNALGGRTYDRGVFRHIMPAMDREYALDMTTYRFSPLETATWTRLESGLRLRTGSFVRAEWAFITDIKHTAHLANDHTLRVDATLQQDPQAQRALIEMSYDWAVHGRHHVGVHHTISQYKPDFDASLFYQYGTVQTGRVRATMTFMDLYHDLVFQALGVDEKDEEFVRDYESHPYLGQLTVQTPARHPLRAELFVGWQPESDLRVQSQFDPAYRYRDRESAHYVGALVAYHRGPVTGGLVFQRDKSTLSRRGLRAAVTSDYHAEQRFQRGGAFLAGAWGDLQGAVWFFLEDYYDKQEGSDFDLSTVGRSLDYTEYRKNYRARLAYTFADPGFYSSVEYLAMSRRMSPRSWVMGNEWTNHWYRLAPSNYRMSGVVGYRFRSGAVEVGMNYDLDGDVHYKAEPDYEKKRFDNGFVRFTLSW